MDATQHEEWRPVPGYEGYYEISSLGSVRSVDRWVRHGGRGGVRLRPGAPISPDTTKRGYLRVALYRDGKFTRQNIHRVLMRAFVGPCPDGMEVRHLNDIKTDNRLCNLEYGTRSENLADRVINRGARTHCNRNHEYTEENTRWARRSDGSMTRSCRACAKAWEAGRRRSVA